ncbi:hypothetical protein [Sutcliffiella rhizosphaerae]|uniref:GyrI-like small molecule binding domain-containing protein n=1 Tax=Sutcliffiella rhizosphaerae TaxID=2880967 RepID=A0ABM8YR34_9BACI|nr:hypothetical protein [Sutcliffiella rhizosphaerae]CAG9622306.1 hypothetical protein BACCIP111883_03097 [Sutcliffiella rhizosphaerae]
MLKTYDYRKKYPETYLPKKEELVIQPLPELKYVSQRMVTSYNMDWDGRPEPIDERWLAWKVVNQIKQISKVELEYKFKLMPPEYIWHEKTTDGKWVVDQMMLVSDRATEEMYERAKEKVKKKLRVKDLPTISFVKRPPTLTAQKLHVGHYKDVEKVYETMKSEMHKRGYQPIGQWRVIYLHPAMDCYPAHNCKTVVSVDVAKN